MLFRRPISATIISVILFLVFINCGAPYKIMPGYNKQRDNLNTIALYPVYYTDDRRDEHKFSTYFNDRLFDALSTMHCRHPVQFIPTDLTLRIFQEAAVRSKGNISGESSMDNNTSGFLIHKVPSNSSIKAVAYKFDAIIFCKLIEYDQTGTGKTASNTLTTLALIDGIDSASDRSRFAIEISLYSTLDSSIIWKYKQSLGRPSSDARSTRWAYTKRIIEDVMKYFPLSQEFEGK